jgi:enamine deaminase RidA (YjgF/YER057c/UK114 family)
MVKQVFRDGTEVTGFYVRTIRSGPFVFVSGTTSLDSKGRVQARNAAAQTLITMRKIEAGLKSAGARLRDLTRLTIFVTDIRDMGAVSKALGKALRGSMVTSTCGGERARRARPGGRDRVDGDGRELSCVDCPTR